MGLLTHEEGKRRTVRPAGLKEKSDAGPGSGWYLPLETEGGMGKLTADMLTGAEWAVSGELVVKSAVGKGDFVLVSKFDRPFEEGNFVFVQEDGHYRICVYYGFMLGSVDRRYDDPIPLAERKSGKFEVVGLVRWVMKKGWTSG